MSDDRNNRRPTPQQEAQRRAAAVPRTAAASGRTGAAVGRTNATGRAGTAGRADTVGRTAASGNTSVRTGTSVRAAAGAGAQGTMKRTSAADRARGYAGKETQLESDAARVRRRTLSSYIKREIAGIVVMILCIFACMSIYFDGIAGVMGKAVKNGAMGLVGITAVVVPVLLLFMALGLLLNKNTKTNRLKLLTAGLVIWFIAAMISAVTIKTDAFVNKNIIQVCTDLCVDGADGIGGGLLGGLLALPLVRLFSVPFTMILLVAVSIICIMIITEVSAVDTAKLIWYGIKSAGKAIAHLARIIKEKISAGAASRAERKQEALIASGKMSEQSEDGQNDDGATVRRNAGLHMRGFGGQTEQSETDVSGAAVYKVPTVGANTENAAEGYGYADAADAAGDSAGMAEVNRGVTEAFSATDATDTEGRLLDLSAVGAGGARAQGGAAGIRGSQTQGNAAEGAGKAQHGSATQSGAAANTADDITFIMKEGPEKPVAERPQIRPGAYIKPDINLLTRPSNQKSDVIAAKEEAIAQAQKLEETLKSFGVSAKVVNIARGPAVTRFELTPGQGVKVNKITNLSDDIALNLAASGIRIEAPIPGKSAIGIEIANKHTDNVMLREGLESSAFINHPSTLAVALGKNITGDIVVADLSKMPHLLIAGATGSGKSVCINSLIMSLLYKSTPDKVKLLMIDPKVVELGVYNGIPHLLIPVVTDPKKAAGALGWAVAEMERRYQAFAEKGARELDGYNAILVRRNEPEAVLPRIVIIIDELADLMMVAPTGVEDAICRLAQKARAAGMYLVVATQRPSVDVITGIIKANIPSRIAFSVSSQVDSRTILDMVGAEKLLGKGDMLYYPIGESKPIRIKGAFVSDNEVESVVECIRGNHRDEYDEDVLEKIESMDSDATKDTQDESDSRCDELLAKAIDMAVDMGQVSVSLLQRKLQIGHSRAGRIVDQMEERGIIGPSEGSKPRQVRVSKMEWQEMKLRDSE